MCQQSSNPRYGRCPTGQADRLITLEIAEQAAICVITVVTITANIRRAIDERNRDRGGQGEGEER